MDCRFYEKEYPEKDQKVMVQVKKVAETAAYVQLCEYNGLECMILLSEVSTRRIRSMLKEIRVGQFCVCIVLSVDEEKGYIDLSRKRVNAQERADYLPFYAQSKTVHSILRQIAATQNIPMMELCEKISWPLYRKHKHANDAFKKFIADNDESVFDGLDVSAEILTALKTTIKRRMTPTAVKLRAVVSVKCFEYEGINAVRKALQAGQALDNREEDNIKVSIKVVAAPHYDIVTESMGSEAGINKINQVLDVIQKSIEASGGSFSVDSKPELLEEVAGMEGAEDESDEDDSDDSEESEVEGMGELK